MNKKLTKAFVENERLDTPLGRLGVPPDSGLNNVLIIAKLTDSQMASILKVLDSGETYSLKS